jgi:muconate cycloisomerase
MRIDRIDIYHYRQPFRIPFHSPQAVRIEADSMLMRVTSDGAVTGWGECVPRAYVTGESIESVSGILQRLAPPLLWKADIGSPADIRSLLAELERRCVETGTTPFQCARAIVDLALIDAFGRGSGTSLEDLFGAPRRPKQVRRSLSIPFFRESSIREMFPAMRKKMDIGAAKVILGEDLESNVKRVALIRDLGGEGLDIRVEANGKWSLDQALRHLAAMEGFGLTGVEQPLPPGDVEGLRKLRKTVGLPIIVDESLCGMDDARRLLDADACDVFNIKVSKCGGLMASAEMAAFVEGAGKRCQVGTHVGETAILGRAAEFIVENAVEGDLWFDVGSDLLLSGRPSAPPAPSDAPGLGLSDAQRSRIAEGATLLATLKRPA